MTRVPTRNPKDPPTIPESHLHNECPVLRWYFHLRPRGLLIPLVGSCHVIFSVCLNMSRPFGSPNTEGQGWGDRHIEVKQKPEGTWATWKDESLKKKML